MGDSVVVGAGIAGLTLALALARRGIASTLLERELVLSEAGAGIQLSPNASRVLVGLGLGPALERITARPEALAVFDARTGRPLVRMPLQLHARGAPYLVLHRADLQAVLVEAATREPLVALRLGAKLTGLDGSGVASVRFEIDGKAEEAVGTVLVGADGVRSEIRRRILGGPEPESTGWVAFRALLPGREAPAWAKTGPTLWLGPGGHLVTYPLRHGEAVNLVLVTRGAGTDDPVSGTAAAARIEGWADAPRALVAGTSGRDRPIETVDLRAPWARGSAVLIGDAAHAMPPFAAQGAAMAIEDAAVLARSLAAPGGTIPDRLRAYEAGRRARVSRVARLARRNGLVYHLAGPVALARGLGMKALGGARLMADLAWLHGWRDGDPSS